MKTKLGFILSVFLIFLLNNCTNLETTSSCKNKCNETQNLCLVATLGATTYSTSSFLGCEIYKSTCYANCTKNSKSSTSRSSNSSSSRSRTSSSSGSRSSGSSTSSGGGSSTSGSGGSSHIILADSE